MMSLFAGGLDVDEPWQGRWEGGVLVECHGEQEREGQNHETKKRQKRETKRPWTTSSSSMPWTTMTAKKHRCHLNRDFLSYFCSKKSILKSNLSVFQACIK
jgi:hypothetical protein